MKWSAAAASPTPLRAVIKSAILKSRSTDEEMEGYYLYIYEGDNNRCTYDYLQDSFDAAKRFAFKNFQVPLEAWRQVE